MLKIVRPQEVETPAAFTYPIEIDTETTSADPQMQGNAEIFGDQAISYRGDLRQNQAIVYSAINSCVRIISGSIAAMPIEIWDNGRAAGSWPFRLDDSKYYKILSPYALVDGTTTFSAFMATLVSDMLLTGNGFAHIERDDLGEVEGFSILDPLSMRAVYGADSRRNSLKTSFQYKYDDGAYNDQLMPDEIIHIRMPQMHQRSTAKNNAYGSHTGAYVDDQVFGSSPLIALSNTLRIGVSAEEFIVDYFTSGLGATTGFFFEKPLDKPQKEAIRRWTERQVRGEKRRPIVLDQGGRLEQVQTDAQSATLAELRKQNVQQVCGVYGLQPFQLGIDQTSTWGTGIAEMMRGYYKNTLHPLVYQIENQFTAKITEGDQLIKFNAEQLIRESPKDHLKMVLEGGGTNNTNPVYTANEQRRMLGLPPLADGDRLRPLASDGVNTGQPKTDE